MLTATEWDKIMLCAQIKGFFFSEWPLLQLPNEPEQRGGGYIPDLYPRTAITLGSLKVTQYISRFPKYLKHTSA